MSFESVVSEVRSQVVPNETELRALEIVVDDLTARANAAVDELSVDAETKLVGSTARGTWLSGERDIDLFVMFPPDLERRELERYGLEVGHAVLPGGHEEYAEHPYVKGEYRGFDVDCVPCYAVERASEIQSAVDRTPFHTAYLEGRIDPLTDDVRVTKAFLSAIGVYGSNLRTRGFSGFLTELLVLEHGGFEPFVTAAAEWNPPLRFDPEGHGERQFDDPLVVVDPTDPERNVAAVCSTRNVARLIHYARELSADPRVELFERSAPEPLSVEELNTILDERGTAPVAIRFETPDIVDDQLYPQLEKSLAGIERALDRAGFSPLRGDCFVADESVLFVECAVSKLSATARHEGPPVGVREHAEQFYEAYDTGEETGPFIDEDGRYVVERRRSERTPSELIEAELFEISLGAHIESALEENYTILADSEVAELAEQFGVELAAYFEPEP